MTAANDNDQDDRGLFALLEEFKEVNAARKLELDDTNRT